MDPDIHFIQVASGTWVSLGSRVLLHRPLVMPVMGLTVGGERVLDAMAATLECSPGALTLVGPGVYEQHQAEVQAEMAWSLMFASQRTAGPALTLWLVVSGRAPAADVAQSLAGYLQDRQIPAGVSISWYEGEDARIRLVLAVLLTPACPSQTALRTLLEQWASLPGLSLQILPVSWYDGPLH